MEVLIYALACLALTLVLIPCVIYLCNKNKWFDKTNSRKVHLDETPRLGSVVIVPVFLAGAVVYMLNHDAALLIKLMPVIAASLIIFCAGVIDDFIELSPVVKFILQCAAAVIPLIFGFSITNILNLNLGLFSYPFTFLWCVALTNAFNLIDGIDALCSSISLLILLTTGYLYVSLSGGVYAVILFLLAAVLAGFIFYNKPKAKIFLGDGGSQFLGYMISVIPIITSAGKYSYNFIPALLVLCSIPVLDTIAAIWRRVRDGHSVFMPDKHHLHHKLLQLGYSTRSTLFFLLAIQTGLCVLSIFIMKKLNDFYGFIILCCIFIAMIGYFSVIHYTYRAVNLSIKKQKEMENGALS